MSIDAMKRALKAMESVAGHVAQTASSDEWAQYCGAMSALRELIWQEPRREWQGLTDAELAEFSDLKLGAYDLCLEVEAKLREKNT